MLQNKANVAGQDYRTACEVLLRMEEDEDADVADGPASEEAAGAERGQGTPRRRRDERQRIRRVGDARARGFCGKFKLDWGRSSDNGAGNIAKAQVLQLRHPVSRHSLHTEGTDVRHMPPGDYS